MMKKTSKRLLALLLSVLVAALAAAGLTAAAADETPTYAGTCGDNITWTLKDGVLTLNGTGVVSAQPNEEERTYIRWDSQEHKLIEYRKSDPFNGSYPWDDLLVNLAIERLHYKDTYGFGSLAEYSDMYIHHQITESDSMKIEAAMFKEIHKLVHTLIVGEGITEIAGGAPQCDTVDLPSTYVATEGYEYDFSLVKNLIIRNPTFDFSSRKVILQGYLGDTPHWKTTEEHLDVTIGCSYDGYPSQAVLNLGLGLQDVFCFRCEHLCDYCNYKHFNQATEEDFLEYLNFQYYQNAASVDEFVQLVLADFNAETGTNFTTLEDVYVSGVCSCNSNYCRENCLCTPPELTVEAEVAVDQLYAKAAIDEAIKRMTEFTYGEVSHYDADAEMAEYFNISTGDNLITPVPWLTVYGYAGSTAETAAATSGVHFEALCPTDHANTTAVNATASTCIAHGYTAGVYCEDCGKWLSGHEELPFGEHDKLGARETIKEPTETEEGQVIITCSVCGERGLYAIEKLPHTDAPADDGGSSGNSGGVFGAIRRAVQGIINWLLRLIKWLGK